jgi:hypothetical protein
VQKKTDDDKNEVETEKIPLRNDNVWLTTAKRGISVSEGSLYFAALQMWKHITHHFLGGSKKQEILTHNSISEMYVFVFPLFQTETSIIPIYLYMNWTIFAHCS